jgi:UDP-GlcNAc:undecaprenyl-phosphate GlcNAc-1-phosphate transferase
VPILDTGFVIAKRIKHKRKFYSADRWHLHHRLANIGFSQRRTVLYLYAWTLSLSALGLALRFVPYSDDHGHFHAVWCAVIGGFALIAFAATLYLIYILEIFKFQRWRNRALRRGSSNGAGPSDSEIRDTIEREIETGEFDTVGD